ncbi:hypothetical protein VTN96DRAFT_1726 [Rasamsonia emersonii]
MSTTALPYLVFLSTNLHAIDHLPRVRYSTYLDCLIYLPSSTTSPQTPPFPSALDSSRSSIHSPRLTITDASTSKYYPCLVLVVSVSCPWLVTNVTSSPPSTPPPLSLFLPRRDQQP